MKKTFLSALILSLLPAAAFAAPGQDDMANKYFAPDTATLTPQARKAIAIGRKWETGQATSNPVPGDNGAITFMWNSGQTQIVCAVLQVCDVALQAGETVNNLNVGDPRFEVTPAISGSGTGQTLHLIIKPLDVALDTSLIVTTDRRTYHFRLLSKRYDTMPFVHFDYPEDQAAKWAAIRIADAKEHQEKTIPSTGEYLGNLDFAYTVTGNTRWKPVRVYNDGRKTIIEMPSAMDQSEAPTLLVVNKDGGIFTSAKTQIVNYRLQGDRYIVDTIFDKAILIAGVGSDQDKVTIVRGGK